MRTYAEKIGEKPFDWNAFLDNAINGSVNLHDTQHQNAVHLSLNWTTCACGNQCDVIHRDGTGMPLDTKLADLGCIFYSKVSKGHWIKAKEILEQIEKRSKELIDQINKTNDGNSN
jgi:hypothetical protein